MFLSKPLKDHDSMPFGKYEGTKLFNVPSSYLLWLYEQGFVEKDYPELWLYIDDNLDTLIEENERNKR